MKMELEMKNYLDVEAVSAEPITGDEADKDISVCIDSLTFGQAIEALKQCKRVARKGWNGKDMYLFLGNGGKYRCDLDRIGVESNGVLGIRSTICELVAKHFGDDAAVASNFDERRLFETLPSIIMKTADNKLCIGWLASQADMLAKDWMILD
jgi:hypothetical protein